eukprot:SAG11_NODE_13184_length_666_cov_1.153439_1_plen_38_part_01
MPTLAKMHSHFCEIGYMYSEHSKLVHIGSCISVRTKSS